MEDVQEMLGQLQKLQSEHIVVREGRCAVVRNRHASCRRCAQACTTGCISLEGGELVVDASKCIGCGTCATLCPTGALEPAEPDDAQLYKRCQEAIDAQTGSVCIACEQALHGFKPQQQTGVVPVVCLGRVEESLMAMLACNGANKLSLLKGDCENCQYKHGEQTAKDTCATANALFGAWEIPAQVQLVDVLPVDEAANAPASGQMASDYTQDVHATAEDQTHEMQLNKVGKDGTLPHAIPGRRRRLLAALNASGQARKQQVSTRLWGRVEIDALKCESCRMCAVFCPTAAITKFDEQDGTFGVDHYAGRCVKCGSCKDICPAAAISIHDDVLTSDLDGQAHVRFAMEPRKYELGGADQTWHAMRDLLGCDQVYNK